LTHFFGVDYRELFDDVLESIEHDMKLGERHGMLHAEEVEVSCMQNIAFVGLTLDSGSPSEATQTEVYTPDLLIRRTMAATTAIIFNESVPQIIPHMLGSLLSITQMLHCICAQLQLIV
jgi:hypothetical protein